MKPLATGTETAIAQAGLPIKNCSYQEFRDPAALHEAYSQIARLQGFTSLVPDHRCLHKTGYLNINDVPLMASGATPFATWPDSGSDVNLIVLMQGSVKLSNQKIDAQISSGGILVASVVEHELRITGSRCAVRLRRTAIESAAGAMAGRPSGVVRRRPRLLDQVSPMALQAGNAQAAAVHSLIRHIDDCYGAGPQIASQLGLDDVVHRLVASLLHPELLAEEPSDLLRHRERAGRESFDELLSYIKANLQQPLRLSDLESRSHYSRRSLQYAFHERLGCSPKQWIREQRLALALEQLQGDSKRPVIRQVALACGYQDLSHFCADFKRRYGMTPLQATRR